MGKTVRVHLVLQGLRGVPVLNRLQDHVEMKICPAKGAGVAEQTEVGEDQFASLGKQLAALSIHDRILLTDHLL